MSEHTPGPWEFNEDFNEVQAHNGMITICDVGPPPATTPAARAEWEANTRLLAAAPDLYNLCCGILECLEAGDKITGSPRRALADNLRAAIKKARGTL